MAPDRARSDVSGERRPLEQRRPPERLPSQPRTDRFDKRAWSKAVMLLNVALIGGVAIIALQHVGGEGSPEEALAPDPAGQASVLPDSDTPTPSVSDQASDPTTPFTDPTSAPATETSDTTNTSPPPVTTPAPKVPVTTRVSFARGDGWPVGAGFRETGRLAWPLGVVDRLMTHGPAESDNSVSWLEKWLKTDVRTIGARVLFAPNHSGSAAITAWHTSVLDTSGLSQPRTGMRLVVQPGGWQLVALGNHGQSVISSGTYTQVGHSASFNLVRRESTVWLTDPTGFVTRVDDPRIGSLSGPWASWELREGKVGDRPAGFQEIWAG